MTEFDRMVDHAAKLLPKLGLSNAVNAALDHFAVDNFAERKDLFWEIWGALDLRAAREHTARARRASDKRRKSVFDMRRDVIEHNARRQKAADEAG